MKAYEVSQVDVYGSTIGAGIVPIEAISACNAAEEYILAYGLVEVLESVIAVRLPSSGIAISFNIGIINN